MIVIKAEYLWLLGNISLSIIGWAFLYLITLLLRFGDNITTKSERKWVVISGIGPLLFLLTHYEIIVIQ